ncbi:MAG: presenilin family intramembrane aspartyl protease PSH [Candidatus Poseidoniaceae archaeon]|nr:presenilin family intramembrane aspartyl protease PSH [Candidatus Poseidoniaceae archaeon]
MGESVSKARDVGTASKNKPDSLISNMIEQAPGMIGMALMFVITIAIAIWLQPFFNAAGLHAFGESGTTQGRWIVLELAAIFAFTFLILWLAKKHLQHFIKYGLLFVLFLALCYTTVPGAHMILVDDQVTIPFEFSEESTISEQFVMSSADGAILTTIVDWGIGSDSTDDKATITKRNHETGVEWNTTFMTFPALPNSLNIVEGPYWYTITDAAHVWSVDKNDGSILSEYVCYPVDDVNEEGYPNSPLDNLEGGCVAALEVVEYPEGDANQSKGGLYILTHGGELVRRNTFHQTNITVHQAKWSVPNIDVEFISMRQTNDEHFLVVANKGAYYLKLEVTADAPLDPNDPRWVDEADVKWYMLIEDNDNDVTAFNIGTSPYSDVSDELMLFGFTNGTVSGFNLEANNVTKETRIHIDDFYEGPINSVASLDLTENGEFEIWIGDNNGFHGLFGEGLVEYVTFDCNTSDTVMITTSNWSIERYVSSSQENLITINSGVFNSETGYNVYGIQWSDSAFIIGLGISLILMIGLIYYPEWYVVNTVGVLVGAGVIVMLGVTFVPTLIVIFMIAAAIYDAWAVYRSKHMLDLADTMIGLNLPILLVAPQDKSYSMLEQQESVRPVSIQANGEMPTSVSKPTKKSKEAMFMGLGDVIFPGMLVVSCVQWIGTGGLSVGLSAMVGGLVGYLILMSYVASGKPQAGLPLLNGGAIVGYIIGGLLFVGSAAFSFGISF